MTLRCGKVLPAFAILAAFDFVIPCRRRALYALKRERNTKPARPPFDETKAQRPFRAARRRPAFASAAIFAPPYFFRPTAAATARGLRAPDFAAEASTAANRLPVPSFGVFFLLRLPAITPPHARIKGEIESCPTIQRYRLEEAPTMTHPNDRPHNNKTGEFEPSQATADKVAAAGRYKAENPNATYDEIAAAVGYKNRGDAWRAVQECREAVKRAAGAELIASEASLLDDQFATAMAILERDHVVVSHGKVITMVDPETREEKPLLDDGPKLAALREMRAIRESYRKLFGVDQPTQVAVSGAVRYEVVGVDPGDLT